MYFKKLEEIMRMEFESDSCRLKVHLTLPILNIDRVIYDNEEVLDDSDALNCTIKRINKLTPKFPEVFVRKTTKYGFFVTQF